MKVDLELVKVVLQRRELDVRTVAGIIEELNQELAAAVDEALPPVKKQFVMLVSDPRGQLADQNVTGWVVQIGEEDVVTSVEAKFIAAAREFNASPRGRRLPVKSFAEACEHIPSRFHKEYGLWVKTKEPVYVVPVPLKLDL